MAEAARSYSAPTPETITALDVHRLPEAVDLVESVAAAHDDAERCTKNDVATRASWVRWATPYRYLGDAYVPKGWRRKHGYELLVSADEKRGIAVAQGDAATGTERMPSTLIDRGPLTRQAVEGNRDQLRFSAEVHPAFAEAIPGMQIWLVLSHFDRAASEIRVEISVPVEFTKCSGIQGEKKNRGHVTKFFPRIILPTIKLGAGTSIGDEEATAGPIDVPVMRRS